VVRRYNSKGEAMLLVNGITLRNALQAAANSGFKSFYKGAIYSGAGPVTIGKLIDLLDKDRTHVFHKKANWKIKVNSTGWSFIKKIEEDGKDNVILWLTM
jgi:hypothetical protein